jgi:6-pyruvoyltetrahydropterin/6-carboxytetrahydropterin synthase
LRNITHIDRLFREKGIPVISAACRNDVLNVHDVCTRWFQTFNEAWSPAELEEIRLHTSPYQSYSVRRMEPQMMRLSQRFEFSAAHRLHNPGLDDDANRGIYGKCNNRLGHGHNYEVQVTLAGRPDAGGSLMAIPEFERLVNLHAIEKLDHKHLNAEVPEFADLNPTVENIAMVIFRLLRPALAVGETKLASVTVWETPKTWCEYAE